MKLGVVIHDFVSGVGHGRYARETVRLAPPDDEIHVLAAAAEPLPGRSFHWRKIRAWRATSLGTVLTFLIESERAVRRHEFALAHAHGLTCWSADLITAHVCNAARHRQNPPARWREMFFPKLVIPLERRFYGQQRPRHLIAVSDVVAREIQTEYGWRRPVSVIHPGVDTDRFAPVEPGARLALRREFQVPATGWLWLFVGEARKGLGQAIRALPEFPTAHLLVVTRSQTGHFQNLAANHGVAGQVTFLPPRLQIERVYQAADVFVYPSEYDTFGLVVAEAMATGLPVVVGRAIGAAEWIESGRDGLLCDPAKVAESLGRLQADAGWALEMGRLGRETAARHTWAECSRKTQAVYEQFRTEKKGRSDTAGARV